MILSIVGFALLVIFSIGWFIAIKIRNFSIVDAMWALSMPLPVLYYIVIHDGDGIRDCILIVMAALWALRLGIHLTKRIHAHHPNEDSRYKTLRDQWNKTSGSNAAVVNLKFFIIFMVNATLVFLLTLPFYFASQHTAPVGAIELAVLIIYLIGIIGEAVADGQLSKFRKLKRAGKTSSQICNIGLWNYSRHPNYFFEMIIWIGIYAFCLFSPMAIWTFHAPIIITFLLLKVTGIPPTEKSLLKSKGDAYQQYQSKTSPFVPWRKK